MKQVRIEKQLIFHKLLLILLLKQSQPLPCNNGFLQDEQKLNSKNLLFELLYLLRRQTGKKQKNRKLQKQNGDIVQYDFPFQRIVNLGHMKVKNKDLDVIKIKDLISKKKTEINKLNQRKPKPQKKNKNFLEKENQKSGFVRNSYSPSRIAQNYFREKNK
ncbi:unnamed protein product [Paramecium pentaurelia]|uniref:Uncharacterized protein n=1 Tax=Paramecium pentaurelia TaxID=43138 RepID=A0A8S1W4F2_9CILI|nr:unnamed protein product [Paramecium pentaurelia]